MKKILTLCLATAVLASSVNYSNANKFTDFVKSHKKAFIAGTVSTALVAAVTTMVIVYGPEKALELVQEKYNVSLDFAKNIISKAVTFLATQKDKALNPVKQAVKNIQLGQRINANASQILEQTERRGLFARSANALRTIKEMATNGSTGSFLTKINPVAIVRNYQLGANAGQELLKQTERSGFFSFSGAALRNIAQLIQQ